MFECIQYSSKHAQCMLCVFMANFTVTTGTMESIKEKQVKGHFEQVGCSSHGVALSLTKMVQPMVETDG